MAWFTRCCERIFQGPDCITPNAAMRKASSRHGVDLPVYILVLDVVAGPFQLAPLINGHLLRFSLGYHGQTSLKLGISHCFPYHTLKCVRCELGTSPTSPSIMFLTAAPGGDLAGPASQCREERKPLL